MDTQYPLEDPPDEPSARTNFTQPEHQVDEYFHYFVTGNVFSLAVDPPGQHNAFQTNMASGATLDLGNHIQAPISLLALHQPVLDTTSGHYAPNPTLPSATETGAHPLALHQPGLQQMCDSNNPNGMSWGTTVANTSRLALYQPGIYTTSGHYAQNPALPSVTEAGAPPLSLHQPGLQQMCDSNGLSEMSLDTTEVNTSRLALQQLGPYPFGNYTQAPMFISATEASTLPLAPQQSGLQQMFDRNIHNEMPWDTTVANMSQLGLHQPGLYTTSGHCAQTPALPSVTEAGALPLALHQSGIHPMFERYATEYPHLEQASGLQAQQPFVWMPQNQQYQLLHQQQDHLMPQQMPAIGPEQHQTMELSLRMKRKAWDRVAKDDLSEALSKSLTLSAPGMPDEHLQNIIGDDTCDQNPRKRRRIPVSIQKKLSIIDCWNKTKSIKDIVKAFKIPRSTIHGIIKTLMKSQEDVKFKERAEMTPDSCRIVESRLRILEKLLIDWMKNIWSRSISLTGKQIRNQALVINRMLSGILKKPLPKCLFSTGWLKGFKKRHKSQLGIMQAQETTPQDLVDRNLLKKELSRRGKDDIYTCEMVSMYLNTPPPIPSDDQSQDEESQRTDNSSATVLICCNTSGTDKRDLLVLIRQDSGTFDADGHYRLAHDASAVDLTTEVLEDWLTKFHESLSPGRKISLLIDDTMWGPFSKILFRRSEELSRITIIKVPTHLNKFRSTVVPISMEFKAYCHMRLEQRLSGTSSSNPPSINSPAPIQLMNQAWDDVKKDDICSYFINLWTLNDLPRWKANSCSAPMIPKMVLQYCQSQDKDIGPTDYLRDRIKAMQHDQDFMEAFGKMTFEKVVYAIQPSDPIKFGGSRAKTSWYPTHTLGLNVTAAPPRLDLYL